MQIYLWTVFAKPLTVLLGKTYPQNFFWFNSLNPPWCKSESQSIVTSSLPALLTSSIQSPPITNHSHFKNNQLVISTLKIWYQFQSLFKFTLASLYNSITPLPLSHLLRHFQVRHCAKSLFQTFPSLSSCKMWDELLGSDPLQKSLTLEIYNTRLLHNSQGCLGAETLAGLAGQLVGCCSL